MATYQAAGVASPRTATPTAGEWSVGAEAATAGTGATLELNFEAEDVYLVLGGYGHRPGIGERRATQTVTVSGEPKLYQLVGSASTESGAADPDRVPGVQAYDFTFG